MLHCFLHYHIKTGLIERGTKGNPAILPHPASGHTLHFFPWRLSLFASGGTKSVHSFLLVTGQVSCRSRDNPSAEALQLRELRRRGQGEARSQGSWLLNKPNFGGPLWLENPFGWRTPLVGQTWLFRIYTYKRRSIVARLLVREGAATELRAKKMRSRDTSLSSTRVASCGAATVLGVDPRAINPAC